MPAKFKESSKVLVNREARKYRVVHYYLKNTSTEELLEAIEKSHTKPKHKQKYRNELVRRNAL